VSLVLSNRDRRVLGFGAGAIALLLLFSRGLPAWRRWDADARASAAELVGQEAAARAQAAGLSAAVDSAEARRGRLARLAPALLDGDSPASAGATLASILTGAAARYNVRLGSVLVTPDTAPDQGFTRVAVRADATGDLQGITGMLAYLENAPELLVFRELTLTQPDAGGAPDRPEALQLEITVQGLALVGPASAASPDPAAGDGAPAVSRHGSVPATAAAIRAERGGAR